MYTTPDPRWSATNETRQRREEPGEEDRNTCLEGVLEQKQHARIGCADLRAASLLASSSSVSSAFCLFPVLRGRCRRRSQVVFDLPEGADGQVGVGLRHGAIGRAIRRRAQDHHRGGADRHRHPEGARDRADGSDARCSGGGRRRGGRRRRCGRGDGSASELNRAPQLSLPPPSPSPSSFFFFSLAPFLSSIHCRSSAVSLFDQATCRCANHCAKFSSMILTHTCERSHTHMRTHLLRQL